jgi:hypothetical protein
MRTVSITPCIAMQISPSIRDLLEVLQTYSHNGLRNPELLVTVLQAASIDGDRRPLLAELSFQGKYLTKLGDALEKDTTPVEHLPHLQSELSRAMIAFHELLVKFAGNKHDDQHEFAALFDGRFSGIKAQTDLAHDLAWLKNFEMDLTRFEKSEE